MTDQPSTTSHPNGRSFWLRLLMVAAPMVLAAAIAWGTLRSQVSEVQGDVQQLDKTKASREVMEAYFQEVLRRLDRIERRLP